MQKTILSNNVHELDYGVNCELDEGFYVAKNGLKYDHSNSCYTINVSDVLVYDEEKPKQQVLFWMEDLFLFNEKIQGYILDGLNPIAILNAEEADGRNNVAIMSNVEAKFVDLPDVTDPNGDYYLIKPEENPTEVFEKHKLVKMLSGSVYNWTNVKVPNGLRLIGNGAKIKHSEEIPQSPILFVEDGMTEVYITDVKFESFYEDANNSNPSFFSIAISIDGNSDILVERCRFKGFYGMAIKIDKKEEKTNQDKKISILNNIFVDCFISVAITDNIDFCSCYENKIYGGAYGFLTCRTYADLSYNYFSKCSCPLLDTDNYVTINYNHLSLTEESGKNAPSFNNNYIYDANSKTRWNENRKLTFYDDSMIKSIDFRGVNFNGKTENSFGNLFHNCDVIFDNPISGVIIGPNSFEESLVKNLNDETDLVLLISKKEGFSTLGNVQTIESSDFSKVGELEDLNTEDKTNIVSAINEVFDKTSEKKVGVVSVYNKENSLGYSYSVDNGSIQSQGIEKRDINIQTTNPGDNGFANVIEYPENSQNKMLILDNSMVRSPQACFRVDKNILTKLYTLGGCLINKFRFFKMPTVGDGIPQSMFGLMFDKNNNPGWKTSESGEEESGGVYVTMKTTNVDDGKLTCDVLFYFNGENGEPCYTLKNHKYNEYIEANISFKTKDSKPMLLINGVKAKEVGSMNYSVIDSLATNDILANTCFITSGSSSRITSGILLESSMLFTNTTKNLILPKGIDISEVTLSSKSLENYIITIPNFDFDAGYFSNISVDLPIGCELTITHEDPNVSINGELKPFIIKSKGCPLNCKIICKEQSGEKKWFVVKKDVEYLAGDKIDISEDNKISFINDTGWYYMDNTENPNEVFANNKNVRLKNGQEYYFSNVKLTDEIYLDGCGADVICSEESQTEPIFTIDTDKSVTISRINFYDSKNGKEKYINSTEEINKKEKADDLSIAIKILNCGGKEISDCNFVGFKGSALEISSVENILAKNMLVERNCFVKNEISITLKEKTKDVIVDSNAFYDNKVAILNGGKNSFINNNIFRVCQFPYVSLDNGDKTLQDGTLFTKNVCKNKDLQVSIELNDYAETEYGLVIDCDDHVSIANCIFENTDIYFKDIKQENYIVNTSITNSDIVVTGAKKVVLDNCKTESIGINENVLEITSKDFEKVGDLENLKTENKENIVKSINELYDYANTDGECLRVIYPKAQNISYDSDFISSTSMFAEQGWRKERFNDKTEDYDEYDFANIIPYYSELWQENTLLFKNNIDGRYTPIMLSDFDSQKTNDLYNNGGNLEINFSLFETPKVELTTQMMFAILFDKKSNPGYTTSTGRGIGHSGGLLVVIKTLDGNIEDGTCTLSIHFNNEFSPSSILAKKFKIEEIHNLKLVFESGDTLPKLFLDGVQRTSENINWKVRNELSDDQFFTNNIFLACPITKNNGVVLKDFDLTIDSENDGDIRLPKTIKEVYVATIQNDEAKDYRIIIPSFNYNEGVYLDVIANIPKDSKITLYPENGVIIDGKNEPVEVKSNGKDLSIRIFQANKKTGKSWKTIDVNLGPEDIYYPIVETASDKIKPIATGEDSLAIGYGVEANSFSTSIGTKIESGLLSTSIGSKIKSSYNSIAIGSDIDTSSTNETLVIGNNISFSDNCDDGTIVIGNNSTPKKEHGFYGPSITIGSESVTNGSYAMTIGSQCFSTGEGATSVNSDRAEGRGAVSIGFLSSVNGENSTSIGIGATVGLVSPKKQVKNSTAIGGFTYVMGDNSVAAGHYSNTEEDNVFSVGNTQYTTDKGVVVEENKRRVVNVADGIIDSDAATVRQLGSIKYFKTVSSIDTLPVVDGTESLAIGQGSSTSDKNNATSVGVLANASYRGTSVGYNTNSSGSHATSIGFGSYATGTSGTALGYGAKSSLAGSVAVGGTSQASSNYSVAVGQDSIASSTGALALGKSAQATHSNSVAIGKNSATVGNDQVSIGNTSLSRQIKFVSAGTESTDAVNKGQLDSITIDANEKFAEIDNELETINNSLLDKQDKLIAGQNITIDDDGKTINSTGAVGLKINGAGGESSNTSAEFVNIGKGITSTGVYTTAVGNNSKTNEASQATAIGYASEATQKYSTSLGCEAKANAQGSTVVGTQARSDGQYSTAVGSYSVGGNQRVTSVGSQAQVTAVDSEAFGYRSKATFSNSTAIGAYTNTTEANQVHIGGRKLSGVTNGTSSTDAVNKEQLDLKQDKLIAGENITIAPDGKTITANVQKSELNVVSDESFEWSLYGDKPVTYNGYSFTNRIEMFITPDPFLSGGYASNGYELMFYKGLDCEMNIEISSMYDVTILNEDIVEDTYKAGEYRVYSQVIYIPNGAGPQMYINFVRISD